MRLVATLSTGYTVDLACPKETLANASLEQLAELMDHELPWLLTTTGAVIRREAIIGLHLDASPT